MKRLLPLLLAATFSASAEEKDQKVVRGHVFAWPFTEVAEMQPRGGTTKGTEVTLDRESSLAWKRLQEPASSSYVKDTQAIIAMEGDYRVSFDFVETMGFSEGYTPPKPYFSWGTEHVKVIALEDRFISLQHTLVMYFKDKEGNELGPMTMKHWRQDWRYEDTDLHTYRGDSTWARETRNSASVKGKWTQAVYQVDDSPRYEVVGQWVHQGGVSVWRSEACWRPLPRREFSVRDDYNILQGTHEITITPTGWVHTQQNDKLSQSGDQGKIVGRELGVNRYERISAPSLTRADEEWKKVGPYWQEVRAVWEEIYKKQDRFTLKSKVDDQKLYQHHFGYAAKILESKEAYDPAKGKAHARETIMSFLADGGKKGKKDY